MARQKVGLCEHALHTQTRSRFHEDPNANKGRTLRGQLIERNVNDVVIDCGSVRAQSLPRFLVPALTIANLVRTGRKGSPHTKSSSLVRLGTADVRRRSRKKRKRDQSFTQEITGVAEEGVMILRRLRFQTSQGTVWVQASSEHYSSSTRRDGISMRPMQHTLQYTEQGRQGVLRSSHPDTK